jgi:CubicO group peptidase (beta-lactamase class C family)
VSAQGKSTCPILGKQWPAPRNISHEPLIQAAAKNLTSKIDNLVKSNSKGWNATSFSITLFSTSEESFAYQYHRTDPLVLHGTAGVRKVTADSVYRIGSISKLLTVYLFLIQMGGHHLHTPITHFVPELLVHANASLDDIDIIRPHWQDITIADLASYLSGLPDDREFIPEIQCQTTNLYATQSQMISPYLSPITNHSSMRLLPYFHLCPNMKSLPVVSMTT